MDGQRPGAPELKGPPRDTEKKKKMKNREEKEKKRKRKGRKEKRKRNFSNTRTGAPPDISQGV